MPTLDDYKMVAEAFADLILQPMGIESWSKERLEEVAQGLERMGYSEEAWHLRRGHEYCLARRVAQ